MIYFFAAFLSLLCYESGKYHGRQKGIEEGMLRANKSMAGRIKSFSYWIVKNPMVHNALYLMGNKIDKYQTFDANRLREDILMLGDTRIGDVPQEEREIILR